MASDSSFCQRRLTSGGLMTNYVCSSACAHCVYRSSPRREKGYITPAMAARVFRKVMALGCRSMHIGGGEPFLNPDGLKEVLRVARTEGMGIDYIETNSSWFTSVERAGPLLEDLMSLGCHTLLISIDPFHNAHIPFAKVKGLLAACRRTGMGIFPWLMEFYDEIDQLDDRECHSLNDYATHFGQDYLPGLVRRYGLNLGGRALQSFRPYFEEKPLELVLSQGRRGCDVLTNGNHFHVDLHGDFVPTRCPGMAVALDDLGRSLSPTDYPAMTCLYHDGPTGLYAMASQRGFAPRDAYLSPCDLCNHVRTFLVRHADTEFPELRPKEFYDDDDKDKGLRPKESVEC